MPRHRLALIGGTSDLQTEFPKPFSLREMQPEGIDRTSDAPLVLESQIPGFRSLDLITILSKRQANNEAIE